MSIEFVFGEHGWTAEVALDAWAGFRSCRGEYGGINATISDGLVLVRAPGELGEWSPVHVAHAQWIKTHQVEIRDAFLASLLVFYAEVRPLFEGASDLDDFMPEVTHPDGFRGQIGLHTVHLHGLERGGVPYLGLELGCSWDSEHGLGAMLHGARVVKLHGADSAFLRWIAERDAAH